MEKKVKIQIKHKWLGTVLFEYENLRTPRTDANV